MTTIIFFIVVAGIFAIAIALDKKDQKEHDAKVTEENKNCGIAGVVECKITDKKTRDDKLTAMRKTFIDSGMDKTLVDRRIKNVIDGNNEATKLSDYDIARFEYIKHADLAWIIQAAKTTVTVLKSELELKQEYNERIGFLLDHFPNSKEIDNCILALSVKLKNIYRTTKELEVLNNRFKELTGGELT